MKNIKKLLFVTGTRADFGKLEPLAKSASSNGYETTFFVTGMHLLQRYGLTRNEVRRSGLKTVEYLNQRPGDPQDIILVKTILGFSDYLEESMPDLVIIHGDRIEALACAIVCATNYVQCAHIEGGEVSGTIDEVFRHCNTKLSHYHLVSSEEAAKRVRRLGELDNTIKIIGSPELDAHKAPSGVSLDEVLHRYEITCSDYGICIFHPVTSELESIGSQANILYRGLIQSGKYFVVILPNNDPGSEEIFEVIARLPKDQFRVLPSMRFSYFSELMKNSKFIVGNSSAGVREAPFLGIPSIDIGTRQNNRSFAESVINMSAQNSEQICTCILELWGERYKPDQSFGSGNATEAFVRFLNQEVSWNTINQKYFID